MLAPRPSMKPQSQLAVVMYRSCDSWRLITAAPRSETSCAPPSSYIAGALDLRSSERLGRRATVASYIGKRRSARKHGRYLARAAVWASYLPLAYSTCTCTRSGAHGFRTHFRHSANPTGDERPESSNLSQLMSAIRRVRPYLSVYVYKR